MSRERLQVLVAENRKLLPLTSDLKVFLVLFSLSWWIRKTLPWKWPL